MYHICITHIIMPSMLTMLIDPDHLATARISHTAMAERQLHESLTAALAMRTDPPRSQKTRQGATWAALSTERSGAKTGARRGEEWSPRRCPTASEDSPPR